jgi:hypothetical protein
MMQQILRQNKPAAPYIYFIEMDFENPIAANRIICMRWQEKNILHILRGTE